MPLYRRSSGGSSSEGALTYKGVWAGGSYPAGSVVKKDGVLYTAKVDTSDVPVLPSTNYGTDFSALVYTDAPWSITGMVAPMTVTTAVAETVPGETATTAMRLYGVGTAGGGIFDVTLSLVFESSGSISFYDRISSETNWDFGSFAIDGVQQHEITGEVPWTQRTYAVGSGARQFRWRYRGDSGGGGSDAYKVAVLRTAGSVLGSPEWEQIALTEIPV